jgi:superfamily I DNA and/or RNA helicase
LKEAKKVIEIYKKEMSKHDSIIILTFNSPQRQLIEKIIIESEPELLKNMENEKLFIRNIENIQGDEADLVIISVVYDKDSKFSSTYVARKGGKNSLNVAISRAKDKMIIVKSINSKDIITKVNSKNNDLQIFKE